MVGLDNAGKTATAKGIQGGKLRVFMMTVFWTTYLFALVYSMFVGHRQCALYYLIFLVYLWPIWWTDSGLMVPACYHVSDLNKCRSAEAPWGLGSIIFSIGPTTIIVIGRVAYPVLHYHKIPNLLLAALCSIYVSPNVQHKLFIMFIVCLVPRR